MALVRSDPAAPQPREGTVHMTMGTKPEASCVLGTRSTAEVHPSPSFQFTVGQKLTKGLMLATLNPLCRQDRLKPPEYLSWQA